MLVIILDQWSKHALMQHFQLNEAIAITNFFNLGLWHNTGAAFSFLHDAGGWQRWFFAGIALLISAVILRWLAQPHKDTLTCVALAAILGGALGNLWDRIQLGYVIDFLDFYVKHWHWPAFNVADSAICIGACLLAWRILFPAKT